MVAGIAAYRRAPQRIIQPLAGRAKQQDDIVQVVREAPIPGVQNRPLCCAMSPTG